MLICHCRVVSDRAIEASIAAGARCTEDLVRMCGAGARCCRPALEALLDELHASDETSAVASCTAAA